jgi:Tfp pilus assembly protein PilN
VSVSVVEWLLNFGVAGVVLVLLVTGVVVPGFVYKELQRDNDKLADALAVERQRNADLQQMAATGAKALDALAEVAQEQRARHALEEAAVQKASRARLPSGGGGTG